MVQQMARAYRFPGARKGRPLFFGLYTEQLFVDRSKMELDAEKRLRTGRRPMRRGEGVRVSGILRRNY